MNNLWHFLIGALVPFYGKLRDKSETPEPPIRSELFSLERLEQHAESLAKAQHVSSRQQRNQGFARRLDDNARVLEEAYRDAMRAVENGQSVTPAAEWLLDNFYVVNEQIREIKNDLPPGFYRRLPKLAEGPLKGSPRVFGLAWALVAHTDSAFDLQKLTRFVEAYQRVQPLTIGELWAIAITLRMTLVENLRRLAAEISARLAAGKGADALADRILGTDTQNPEPESVSLDLLNRTPWSTAFSVQLAMRLRDRDPDETPALRWLNQKLAAQNTTADQIVRDDVHRQGALNVSIRNVVMSMRLITTINWPEFFESVSHVDAVLRAGSDFAQMDFQTRDLYRRAIEDLAHGCDKTEIDVAQAAVAAAQNARKSSKNMLPGRNSDPGFYLISRGRVAFEKQLGCGVSAKTRLIRAHSETGVLSYVGLIGVSTGLIVSIALYATHAVSAVHLHAWVWIALTILAILPASDAAIAIVNRLITQSVSAMLLPGLELRDGVPSDMRTIVVVPTLLTSRESIEEQIERLEVHYLSNPDDNITFALLSDWTDSAAEHAPTDEMLLNIAIGGIAELNKRYARPDPEARFALLHRKRLWNAGEQKWLGWERKRGKLHELNRLLRGATDTTFVTIDSKLPSLPAAIRYVVTLDADTRMPIGTVKRLIGKIAHPLNKPQYDPATHSVVAGHGILQPRVTPSLPIGREGSLYQRVFSGPNGLDPYALAISDVYQDLFEEGSFVGKGIYDADIFEAVMQDRLPENAILSHDLLEGIFNRAGLATDIEIIEEFPSRYDVASARQHRWVRGDWQLLPWIFGFGRNARGEPNQNPVSWMGRWKLLDNLRRSLSAPAALLAFIVGWLLPFKMGAVWTAFILATIALPPLLPALFGLIPRRVGISVGNHLRSLRADFVLGLLQSAFLVTFLAHQAWLMIDAILRTLSRLFIHRRRLLEWVTAAQAQQAANGDSRSVAVQILASVAFAGAIALIIMFVGYHAWYFAVPFTAVWVLSPLAARWAGTRPQLEGHLSIAADKARELRLIARRTWRFFEKFVTAEDHDLPPDNFQEDPKPIVAHRTSPTNIGLYLLSVVAGRDFGWFGTSELLDRLEATFATIRKMEKFKGHLFNWYDTTDLRALLPKYISSVDSGNLAGHLLALGNACREICAGPVVSERWIQGLKDAVALIEEAEAERTKLRGAIENRNLNTALKDFSAVLKAPTTPLELSELLGALTANAAAIADAARGRSGDALGYEVLVWAEALQVSIAAHKRDLEFLLPWAAIAPATDGKNDGLSTLLGAIPPINGIRAQCEKANHLLEGSTGNDKLVDALETSARRADVLMQRLSAIADEAKAMFTEMEFGFLFNQDRQLLSIGFRESDGSLDPNFYDLLASEARLTSFIAIAKGDIPPKHWFRMGRTMTPVRGGSALISWSGSMFEYLMPSLVMRAPAGSLLEQTNRLIVRRQEDYGDELGVPWGISESQYNARDLEQTYQYSSFGVPDLGYKRGLGENTVIAPYASGLAAMVDPVAAAKNFKRMAGIGGRGTYGWYEALDYTPSRVPEGAKVAIVHAFMSHHQAMALIGIANALHDGSMRERFHAEPIIQATELLLQERMPRDVAVARTPQQQSAQAKAAAAGHDPRVQRKYNSAHSRVPRTHILSNGNYSAMVTASGSGYSRWRDVTITRWREDVTCDNWGAYIFLRDLRSGDVWSAGYQPTGIEPDSYNVVFSEDRAEIIRNDGPVSTTLEIAVSPEDDGEVRRVSITNHGTRAREIEITSYAELALARQGDDLAHPAFAKLFVETEFAPSLGAILATRRRRSDSDPMVWAAHLCVVEGETAGDVQFETDRARFLGRGQTNRSPSAVNDGWPLSNSAGAVLDPIFSLRRRVRIPRGGTVRIAFWTLAAATRDAVLDLADKHHDAMAFDRATTLAWTQAQMQLHHLGVKFDEAMLFQRLANHVLYTDPTLRPTSDVIKRGMAKSSTLWANGISGDRPIVLVRIENEDDIDLVQQLLRAHEYWRLKQLAVDLVILNEKASSYVQDLQIALDSAVRMSRSIPNIGDDPSRGSAFVLRADMVSPEVHALLLSSARAVLQGDGGTLAEQINRARERKSGVAPPPRKPLLPAPPESPLPRPAMQFFNGFGGFAKDGAEYVTILEGGRRTPAPWINVIANAQFGFHVSTDGSGFTWSVNSQQYQITPWSNDAVGDAPGEILYVRDDETGEVWGPTALPICEKTSPYTIRHGQGYSKFEHDSHGIALELTQFVPINDSIKIARLKIANHSGRERRLSIAAYVEWVLGQSRGTNAPFVVTEIDAETGALFAQNSWNNAFGGRTAFVDLGGEQTAWTGDRTEFLGRDGAADRPLALTPGAVLSNRTGAGLDPCGVLQTKVRLNAVGTTEIVFFLGEAVTKSDAQALVKKYREADLNAVFNAVTQQWDKIVSTVKVKTPDRALDILLNRWLVYQTLACRVWARCGFYQASGAYGFRDQLQDVMALCISRPDIAREHILRATGRQFAEGDVQHWWLPETGNGIRTRVSDDRGWLAFVVAHYVETTGDMSVLDELVPFLEGPVLRPDQHDNFFPPTISDKKVSVFEHCALALDKSLETGAHGLPLMGTGDWNDGMDQVGGGGKGESVWLGWFLHAGLTAFSAIADKHGQSARADSWRAHAKDLRGALDTEGWDGDWYRRAYFDDGTPLGSIANSQCRIDSIAQSWSVISGGAEPARATRAMEAVDKFLIKREEKLSLLFTPPFDHPQHDPGYIKGYPPGVRENGGQYTHGATWAALAFAMLGDGDKAGEILSLLNPINHSSGRTDIDRYKVEPYVICADVYSVPPHAGRGGWTWYTGSAGWTYRIALEWLLGFRKQGDKLLIDPCIPRGWPSFEICYRHGTSQYDIAVENPLGVCRGIIAVKLDGQSRTGDDKALIPLVDDGQKHRVQIVLG